MKVKCMVNNIYSFDELVLQNRLKKFIKLSDGLLDLSLNKDYEVYGIVFRDNSPWYYLCTDETDTYPKPYPCECFKVVDDVLPSYWRLCVHSNEGEYCYSSLVFREWAEDFQFYEKLLDGNINAEKIFQKYRKLKDSVTNSV